MRLRTERVGVRIVSWVVNAYNPVITGLDVLFFMGDTKPPVEPVDFIMHDSTVVTVVKLGCRNGNEIFTVLPLWTFSVDEAIWELGINWKGPITFIGGFVWQGDDLVLQREH